MNKASNIAMCVSLCINVHKHRCPVVYNYQNLLNFGVCKGVKSFGKQSRNHTGKCICRFGGFYAYCLYFIDRKW